MAEVVLNNGLARQQWINKYLTSYVRISGFKPYMSTRSNAIIRVRNEFKNEAGDVINIPLILELQGRGVIGSEVLEGNEEEMGQENDQLRVNWRRNGVVVPKSTQFRTEIDLLNAARERLVKWSATSLRTDIISAFKSVIIPGTADADGFLLADSAVSYETSTAGQRNTYLQNNNDRMLFGIDYANSSSGNWATSLGNVDATNDRMSAQVIDMAKAQAKQTTNNLNGISINPYMVDDDAGRDWFVMFMGSRAFYQATRDPIIAQADRDARERGVDTNPIFQGGDRIYNGVILREIPELTPIPGAGAAGVDVDRSFLCGTSALAIGYGQDPTPRTDKDRDFQFRPAVAIEELRGQKKTSYRGTNFGTVEVFTAAPTIGS